MNNLISLNVPQTVFTIFFAIVWGTAANAQPRWRAFAWPYAFRDKHSAYRLAVSVAILNLLPLFYFVLVLSLMVRRPWNVTTWAWPTAALIFGAVVSGFAAFAFYRLWMGIILLSPRCFYGFDGQHIDHGRYPDLKQGDLDSRWCAGSFAAGLLYVAVSFLPLLIAECAVR